MDAVVKSENLLIKKPAESVIGWKQISVKEEGNQKRQEKCGI